ncbi:MAG: hypothetical protein WC430_01345 [Patescibacteria group bacterium]
MMIKISKSKIADAEIFIRRSGYGRIFDRRSGQTSYVRRLDRDLYPRFHIYIEETETDYIFNLHLDQRQTIYEGVSAHSGDYVGTAVEKEVKRISAPAN